MRLAPNSEELIHPFTKEKVAISRAAPQTSTSSSTAPNLLDLKTVIWDVSADLQASMAGMFNVDASAAHTHFLSEFGLTHPVLQIDPATSVEAVYGNAATLLFKSTAAAGTVTSLTGAAAEATVDSTQVSAQYVGQHMGSSDAMPDLRIDLLVPASDLGMICRADAVGAGPPVEHPPKKVDQRIEFGHSPECSCGLARQ